jgi:phage tail tape-measure protein
MQRQLIIGLLAVLAACGTTQQERTTGGAAAGAATGAGVGALAGPPGMVAGALIGGGAGAATGATTSPSQVNLGKPPWTNPETRVPTPGGPASTAAQRTRSRTNAAAEHETVEELNQRSLQAAQQGGNYRP